MSSKIAKIVVKQITGIKMTPVLQKTIKKTNTKLVVHTYSGEYFPLYKSENKLKSANEYQAYD